MSIENAAEIRAAEKAEIVAEAHRLLDADFRAFMLILHDGNGTHLVSGGQPSVILKLAAEALIDASETINQGKHHFESR